MKRYLLILALIAFSAISFGQSIMVKAPNLVSTDEQFNLSFVIEAESSPSSFKWDGSEDFQVVWGPQKGSSTSISIINGKTTKSSQTTYTYVLLPKRAGSFSIPAAEAVVKGKTIFSRAATVEVVGDKSSSGSQDTAEQPAKVQERTQGEDIYMRLYLSKSSVVVGETVKATLKLYQRANVSGFEDAHFPSFEGFWSQEIESPSNIEFQRENVGGEIYNSAVIRSWSLVAQRSGDIEITPAELVCLVTVRAPRASTGSILDDFFQDDYRTVRKRLLTPSVKVHVAPLPAPAPASFGGGVGVFQMSASLSKESLRAHDAASLKVKLSGKGNLALMEAPKISFPPDFEQYDVKVTDAPDGKVFEYPFIPRSHGDFVIEPVEYSYFDINSKKYVTLKSKEMHLSVERGVENQNFGTQSATAPVGKKDIRNLGNDIRFIYTKLPSFSSKGEFFAGSALFWIVVALLFVAAFSFWLSWTRLASKRADVVGSKRSGATKMARRRLATAGEYLKKNLYSAFYEELHKALLGYVGDKLNMDISDMSKDNISARLCQAGAAQNLCDEYVALLDACEFARYSPSAGQEAMNEHFEKAVSVISSIDDSMKKKKTRFATKSLSLVLLAGMSFSSFASPVDSLWVRGVEAYGSENWEDAAVEWEQILSRGIESPQLYYNIGNARFKIQQYGKAIVSYKRALRMDPGFKDAAFNLEFAQSKCMDKMEAVPEFFVKTLVKKPERALSSDTWAVFSILLLAVTLALSLLFILGNSGRSRKIGFFAGIVCLILSLSCAGFAFGQKRLCISEGEAVVLAPVSSVKSSPGSSSTDLFVLHEGACLNVLEMVGEWVNVSLPDGRQGWIKSGDIEII